MLAEPRNLIESAYRIAQADHQKQKCEVPALLAIQSFPECPVDNGQFVSSIVVQQISGVRIAMEDRNWHCRKKWNRDQSLDKLLG